MCSENCELSSHTPFPGCPPAGALHFPSPRSHLPPPDHPGICPTWPGAVCHPLSPEPQCNGFVLSPSLSFFSSCGCIWLTITVFKKYITHTVRYLHFLFLNSDFDEQNDLFWKGPVFINFSNVMSRAFGSSLRILACPRSWRFSSILLSKVYMVPGYWCRPIRVYFNLTLIRAPGTGAPATLQREHSPGAWCFLIPMPHTDLSFHLTLLRAPFTSEFLRL